MGTYSLAVCEDDKVLREEISRLCDEILSEFRIPHEIIRFSNAEELERFLDTRGEIFDVLLLDIELGNKTGMELAKVLRAIMDRVSIIFLTGHEEYLKDGYSVQPLHFLLKPFKREELAEALHIDWELNHKSKTVFLRKGSRSLNLPAESILYAETNGNHGVRIALEDREEEFPVTLSELEQLLPQDRFVRCHKSYLVNLEHVREFSRFTFYMDNGLELLAGRKYYKKCQSAFVSYMNR